MLPKGDLDNKIFLLGMLAAVLGFLLRTIVRCRLQVSLIDVISVLKRHSGLLSFRGVRDATLQQTSF